MSESISILIVDDSQSIASTLADILELKGYTAHAVNSGTEALQMLRTQPADILLTDIRMPDMNGVELYRAARKMLPKLVALFMTAYSADDIIQEGMAEGIKAVITKPVDIDLLLSMCSAYQYILPQAD